MWFKSSITTPAVATISFCLVGGTSPAAADILHVPGDFPTIQAGIDAAVNGDQVVVADGIYTGPGNKNLDYQGKLITVQSANGPDKCTIDCEGAGRGFYFHSGETKDAIVQGFTITNGFASGTVGGGGMYNYLFSSPLVTNCTFSRNSAGGSGGGMANFLLGSPTVTNCILWDDTPNEMFNDSAAPVVSYSDLQGGLPAGAVDGGGNIDADPMFVAPGIGDYRLSPGSPCIDAADNTAVPKGITTDLDGNPRFVDDPCTNDTGNPGAPGPIIDMGAYEFQVVDCPADLNGDGDVNAADLAILLGAWGPCPGGCAPDLTGDEVVDAADLATLLGACGPC